MGARSPPPLLNFSSALFSSNTPASVIPAPLGGLGSEVPAWLWVRNVSSRPAACVFVQVGSRNVAARSLITPRCLTLTLLAVSAIKLQHVLKSVVVIVTQQRVVISAPLLQV